jgi:monoamine oxidase
VTARNLAAAAVADVTGGFTRRPCWRVAGGNQLVARHIAGRLGTSVRLRSAVRSVEYDREQVRLLTDDGEVRGDAVILAVPMAVLRALPFAPEVPRTYRSAWQPWP